MAKNQRKSNERRVRKVDHAPREDFASPPRGWGDEAWRVRRLAEQLEEMAAKARVLADRYEVRYRVRDPSSDVY
jgi:hypothetical protein